MLSFRYLLRLGGLKSHMKATSKVNFSSSSAQYLDHKDPDATAADKVKIENPDSKEVDSKKNQAINKLNSLLTTMVGEEYVSSTVKALNTQLARPKRQLKEKLEEKAKNDSEPLVTAAKKVAESFGGDVKQTESELLTKLRQHGSDSERKKSSANLNELIVGMKIDREKKPPEIEGRASQVRRIQDNRRIGGDRNWREKQNNTGRKREEGWGSDHDERRRLSERRLSTPPMRVNLFERENLGIFKLGNDVATMDTPELATWQSLQERELRLAVTHPPANVFEEMILWTEQGKLWKFPIDNEQGLECEQQVYFSDHVFLEPHLEPWCPRQGPVRHFMELVCVGLSKNPYLNVREKREHIDWFREYFQQKQEVLMETGAIDVGKMPKVDA